MSYLNDYEEINEGHVAFRGNPKGGKIKSKCTIRTDPKSSYVDGFKPSSDDEKKVDEDQSKGSECKDQEKQEHVNSTNNVNAASTNGVNDVGENISIELPFDPDMPALEDIGTFDFSNEDEDDDEMADMNNLETTIKVIPTPTTRIHKDHPLDQVIRDLHSATQTRNMSKNLEKHRIKAIWLFLAYASFKDFIVYQIDVKSAFLYEKFKEEVHVRQPSGFKYPDFPDRVYKVEKALYGLHQAPRAWYETMSTYVLDNLKEEKLTGPCSSKGTKNASTPMETQKPLLKDEDGEEVDVHTYRSMIGSLMYLTSSRPDIMFVLCACVRYQVNPKVQHLHAVKRIFSSGLLLRQEPSMEKDKYMPRKPRRKDTQVPQLSVPTESVADEDIYKELDDSLVRAATTASSLEAKQDSGNINNTQSKATPNESSSQGTNSGGGPRCQDTIGDIVAQTRVLDLEQTKTTQTNENDSLKRRVMKLEKKQRSRTHKLKRLYKVGLTARVESSDDEQSLGEDASKRERISDIDADEGITLVSTHDDVEMFDANQNLHGEEVFVRKQGENVVKKEVDVAQVQVSTAATTATILIGEVTLTQALAELKHTKPKANAKGIVFHEPEVLQAEEKQELNDAKKATLFMQLLEKRGKFFAAKKEKENRNRPPTRAQQRSIITELVEESSKKAKAEVMVGSLKRAGTELEQESSKKQKIDDDK
nr:hypothetical protein [Tanacetum cinerariifolium]